MKPLFNTLAHKLLAAAGLSAVRLHQTYEADRGATMRRRNVDLVIDVGANVGQYASRLRREGYAGEILSIEPLPGAFKSLEQTMGGDRHWSGINAAAGPKAERATFNISADSVCSSLLKPTSTLLHAIPSARVVETVQVDVVRLDDLSLPPHKNLMLKLDVQGFEKEALSGAYGILQAVDVLELELGVKPGYESGYTLDRALPELTALGFAMTSIGRGVSDPETGELVDIDVLVERAR